MVVCPLVCICLDFLKPKTRINKKVDKKMCLAEPKTQLFKKSCVLGSAKIQVRNALNLWTSEVHKSKRAAGFWTLLPLDVAFTKMPLIYLTQTHQFSHTHPSHPSALHAARPHPHASQPRLYFCVLLHGKLLPLLLLSFFRLLQRDFNFFFFFFFNFCLI